MSAEGAIPKSGRRTRRRREGLPDTPDPVDIAMAALNGDTALADPARALLLSHERLIQLQMTSERLDQVARRIAIGLKLLLGLAGLAVVAAVGAMIWDAASHRGLVVESFQVPPSLAAQGLSGEVVAGQIVDRLADMRGGTDSSRAVDELKSGWRQDYRVAIPQTGVSIGEVQQALRGWLGEETRISGEIYRAPTGLT